MKYLKYSLAVLFTAAVAFGAAQSLSGVSRINDPKPQHFVSGMYIGEDAKALADTGNKVTRSLGASATIDFAAGTIVCEDSSAITVTGAAVGDPCFVGIPATFTAGGTGLHHSFTCYVSSTNNVKVRACAAGTADNPGSATFNVRVISSQ